MQWYYADNGQIAGPVDDATLTEMVTRGQIESHTLVWHVPLANWQPYREVAGDLTGAPPGIEATAEAAAGKLACAECGHWFAPDDMITYAGNHICAECKPRFFQKIREGVNTGEQLRYAGFMIRLVAVFIDAVLLGLLMIPLNMILQPPFPILAGVNPFTLVFFFAGVGGISSLAGFALGAGYRTYLHGSRGQTLGKMACGIRVVKPDGSGVGYANAFGRYCFSSILLLLPAFGIFLWLGAHLMAGFDREKRALHDHIAGTRVIHIRNW